MMNFVVTWLIKTNCIIKKPGDACNIYSEIKMSGNYFIEILKFLLKNK